ncbi:Os03g0280550 [Oryza sativa Japonica Group]|uniref:Os03g0280550 protein n=1 Tax=Oryza sativa subsp. japonica TaxID=39947 RepID=A0A0P0VWP7_ORYSJ|nr:Os03g0280550 [Oryza sativa Japonica Group]
MAMATLTTTGTSATAASARSEVVDSAVSPPRRCSSSFVLSILIATGKFGSRGAHDGAAAPRRCVCAEGGGDGGLAAARLLLVVAPEGEATVFSRWASGQRVGATVGQWVVAG